MPRDMMEDFLIRLYEKLQDGETFTAGCWAGQNIREVIEALSDAAITEEYASYAC